jgi:hypothetical protein
MANPDYPLSADDDLPRTLRREKEAREREAQRRTGHAAGEAGGYRAPELGDAADRYMRAPHETLGGETFDGAGGVTVNRLDIPFFRLVLFFIKAVFAAIPALILLGALLWLVGDILMAYFPQLVKMQIIFKVPN